ncbi:hypothetical protein F5B22DRAFT_282614 [Xylaria bambusicola]|uniref:uncharacterized protein n=1 Tax=Xylaria bambusicola TaxID=326684 RepID=UPI0020076E67|nr:uncharacterized protein F5B22DRAFT_282614 [Xylaria bambusicola]KAI0512991.1 hypothetical protein F5B22DRAFT_282614 [Xylaria bambusicola]
MADKYVIRVTAGSDYNTDNHVLVPVNSPETVKISNDLIDAEINVRVQNYNGLPRNSPTTSPYFSLEPHASNDDQYSLAIRFTPKRPKKSRRQSPSAGSKPSSCAGPTTNGPFNDDAPQGASEESSTADEKAEPSSAVNGIPGHDLQFGNDFDHPIRDRLPPGFSYAMNIVKWWIDPGLDGDPYADMPYLYGPGLSSFNNIYVGFGEHDPEKGGLYFDEGGDEAGMEARRAIGAPDGAKERKKWALAKDSKDKWVFEYEKTYCVDFFNPYIDFKDFSLRLPGFTLPIMKYWDGQDLRDRKKRSHTLRYVLRNRTTEETYLVILFSLYLKEDVNEDGSLKPAALEATHEDKMLAVEAGKIDDADVEKGKDVSENSKDEDVD